MSKRVPYEERRVSTTFAVSQNTLRLIDTIGKNIGISRSGVVNIAIDFYYRWLVLDEDPHSLFLNTLPVSESLEKQRNAEEDAK